MDMNPTADPATACAHAGLERERGHPSRLWSSLVAGWTRHLDRQIEEDLRWFDIAGPREDIRGTSRG
jgi:hypothetical protein